MPRAPRGVRKSRGKSPTEYPDVGVYQLEGRRALSIRSTKYRPDQHAGTVGLLLMRSYALTGNIRHYDAVIKALEARGLKVIPAFAAGLDARPAVGASSWSMTNPL